MLQWAPAPSLPIHANQLPLLVSAHLACPHHSTHACNRTQGVYLYDFMAKAGFDVERAPEIERTLQWASTHHEAVVPAQRGPPPFIDAVLRAVRVAFRPAFTVAAPTAAASEGGFSILA